MPTTPRGSSKRRQDAVLRRSTSQEYLDQRPRVLRKYLRRQDKQRKKTLKTYGRTQKLKSKYNYTKILFAVIILTSITALFFDSAEVSQFIYLNLDKVLTEFTVHTFFTSLFISTSSFGYSSFGAILNLFFLFFMLFFLYFMARNIEMSHGASFLIKLYIISGLFSALFYVLLRLALFPLEDLPLTYVGLAWGGLYGLISYIIFPMMSGRVRAYMSFMPMRMSGRSFLITIILIRLMFGLLYAFYSLAYLLIYLPELGGILGSYLIYKYKFLSR
ncbi:MAG: hypothetical protein ACFFG0_36165 [Candidatus Thorarchaeota archaeon]